MDRSEKVATPPTAVTVLVPDRVPAGEPVCRATVTLAVEEVRLLAASRSWTVGAGVIEAPETVLVGWTPKARWVAAPAVMAKALEVAPARVPLVASSL